MNMTGSDSNRIHRQGSASRPANETRWLVPSRPYTPPKNSAEYMENAILMGVGVAVVIFGFAVVIMSGLM